MSENPPPEDSAAPSRWPDTVRLGGVALLLYIALGVDGFQRVDSVTFYMLLAEGVDEHPLHVMYLPLVATMADALQALGLSLFRSMVWTSSIFAAVAVVVAHRTALLLGASRGLALGFAAWFAVAPSVVHFATTVEVQGVFLGFAATAFLAAAGYAARPSPVRAALVGLSCGVAASVHATGQLLPFAAAAFALAVGVPIRRVLLRDGALGVLAHAVGYAATLRFVAGVNPFERRESAQFLGRYLDAIGSYDVGYLPRTLWHEWLWPFAPLSLLLVVAWFVPRCRRMGVVLSILLVPYLCVAHLLLGGAYVENGAYVLPLALPAAWVSAQLCRRWPRPLLGLIWLLTLAAAVVQRDHPTDAGNDAASPAEVIAAAGDEGVVVFGNEALADAVILARPGYTAFRLDALRMTFLTQGFETFDAIVNQFAAAGRPVIFDVVAVQRMQSDEDPFLAHLRSVYEFEPLTHGRFRALRLRRR